MTMINIQMPQLPPEAHDDVVSANSIHARVFLCEIEPTIGGCLNCGGAGAIWLQFETKARGSMAVITFVNDPLERIAVKSKSYPCPICANSDRVARIEYAWNHSGLEQNERDWRVDYIAGMDGKEHALQAAHNLLSQTPAPSGIVTMFGDYGRGKTGLLKSMTAQFILAGVSARYARAADLLGEIRSTYGDEARATEDQILARVGALRFLAVDEVDRIASTDWAMSIMMRVLDTRYSRRGQSATVIATNQRPDEMPAQWGYLQSRLRDGIRVPIGGADLRG